MNIVKINHDHAPCTRPPLPPFSVSAETVVFQLAESMGDVKALAVWFSNFQNESQGIFQRLSDVNVSSNRTFMLHIPVGAMYTISTITSGPRKGSHGTPPASEPSFPLPYSDNFQGVEDSQEAKYFTDQIGAFEVHADMSGNKVMRQMVPELPIGWSDHGSNGPVSLIGMREWQDIFVEVFFRTSSNITAVNTAACVGTRVDQMWSRGAVFCVYALGNWTLSIGGPKQSTGLPSTVLASGHLSGPIQRDTWHSIALTTINTTATGLYDSHLLFEHSIPNLDTGFVAIGTNGWYAIEFDKFSMSEAGNWSKPVPLCKKPATGDKLGTRACATNGFAVSDESFTLRSDWAIEHDQTGLCVQAEKLEVGSSVVLAPCDASNPLQQFKNDYTLIRNTEMPVYLDGTLFHLSGTMSGTVGLNLSNSNWNTWSYFPNTHQLRNQYTSKPNLGYPMCLTVVC